jgi:tRNA (guanine37-N1)-methyltransferase
MAEYGLTCAEQLPAVVRDFLSTRIKGYVPDVVEIGYDYWSACKPDSRRNRWAEEAYTAAEILNAILPNVVEEDAPSSFTLTGHIGGSSLKGGHRKLMARTCESAG